MTLSFKDELDKGVSPVELARDDRFFGPYIRYGKNLHRYAEALNPPRVERTRGLVFYGDPGTFKSFSASLYERQFTVPRPHTNGATWFDGYSPAEHAVVVFDDFYGWVPYSTLLALVDRYQCSVQTKGGMANFSPQLCVFTSNTAPDTWYDFTKPHMELGALQRRLDGIYHHYRTDVELNDVPAGSIMVEAKSGNIKFHPLHPFLLPVVSPAQEEDPKEIYVLDEDALADSLATQPLEDAEVEFFADLLIKPE